MKIFITAINGFLGRAIGQRFETRGHTVTGSTRRTMELGRPFDATVFENQDALIHCAHDFTRGAHERNVTGTKAWMETAEAMGLHRQIFLSSCSARVDAASEYGRTKHEIEQLFLEHGHTVLRPGLVRGEGGLYARQRAALLRIPIVPALAGGTQPVATVSLEDLLAAAEAALYLNAQQRNRAFNLFDEPMPTYRDFVRSIRVGKATFFLPIPSPLAVALAVAAQFLHLPAPVKPGQIRALAENEGGGMRSGLKELLAQAKCG